MVHELGHVLAIRLAGKEPTAVHLLGPLHRGLAFYVRTVPVKVGAHTGGSHPGVRRRDVRHTLAVIRLRQGRPKEVHQLCIDALDASLEPAMRATVLATTAIARHQLLLEASARKDLREALELDPSAQLVMEAASVLSRPVAV